MPRYLTGAAFMVAALLAPAWVASQTQPPAPAPAGAVRPGAPGTPGQPAANEAQKTPTAAIRGHVLGADGRAIRGAQVNLVSAQQVVPGGVTTRL